MALLAIVQDIGADKGILLSEVGFQSGAIMCIKGTNVILTSLGDLKEQVRDSIDEATIAGLHWRWKQVNDRLYRLHEERKIDKSSHLDQMVKLCI